MYEQLRQLINIKIENEREVMAKDVSYAGTRNPDRYKIKSSGKIEAFREVLSLLDTMESGVDVAKNCEILQELKEILLKSHRMENHVIDQDGDEVKYEVVDSILPVIYVEGKIKEWLEE